MSMRATSTQSNEDTQVLQRDRPRVLVQHGRSLRDPFFRRVSHFSCSLQKWVFPADDH